MVGISHGDGSLVRSVQPRDFVGEQRALARVAIDEQPGRGAPARCAHRVVADRRVEQAIGGTQAIRPGRIGDAWTT
jgi:hypothetical protein